MFLKKYNNFLNYGRWSNKDTKFYLILDLVGVSQQLVDDSNKPSDKSNRDPTKVQPAYIRYLPLWMLKDPKEGFGKKKNKNGK